MILPEEVKIPHAIKVATRPFVCVGKTGFERDGVSCSYDREVLEGDKATGFDTTM